LFSDIDSKMTSRERFLSMLTEKGQKMFKVALFPLAQNPTQKSIHACHFTVYDAEICLWPPVTQWHGWLKELSSI